MLHTFQYEKETILKMSIAASFLLSVGVLMTEVTMLIMVVVLIHVIIGKKNFDSKISPYDVAFSDIFRQYHD